MKSARRRPRRRWPTFARQQQVTERVIMKRLLWPLAVIIVPAILGAAGLLVARAAPPAPAAPPDKIATLRPAASPSPTPAITSTASGRPRATLTPRQAARPRPHLTGPWAVVSAYYRDVEAHKYAKAWALISSGLVTGQTYQQFVAGYACTGTERPIKLGQSGHQVSFNLAVVNNCTGAAQYYTGSRHRPRREDRRRRRHPHRLTLRRHPETSRPPHQPGDPRQQGRGHPPKLPARARVGGRTTHTRPP